jgi:hypothetical protein
MPAGNVSPSDDGTIERKLRAVLFIDDSGCGVIGRAGKYPAWSRHKELTETELDVRDWGTVYGMTVALMREQDPWEGLEYVTSRAVEVAWRLYRDWGGGEIAEPTRPMDGGEVMLSAEQRAAFIHAVDERTDFVAGLAGFVGEWGPMLGAAEQMIALAGEGGPRTVTFGDRDAVRRFIERVVGEDDDEISSADVEQLSVHVARVRERRDALASILTAMGGGDS